MYGEKFGIENHITFERKFRDHSPLVRLSSLHSECQISLHGAQVLSFIPKGSQDVLWLSSTACYQKNRAIRGGIPLCFPWFASVAKPAHGFARLMEWEVVQSGIDEKGNPHILLRLESNNESKKLFDYDFCAELIVNLSKKLQLTFIVKNHDKKAFIITEAMHSYFNISHVSTASVFGLENIPYIDSLDSDKVKSEDKAITIEREVDRIYHDSGARCVINDTGFNREIIITKENSASTIVWNPWRDKSRKMDDFEEDGYHHMLCVESGNVGENEVHIKSGETHKITISIEEKNL